MTCESQCYTIGGPWITYDPNCPFHGDEARRRESEQSRLDLDRDTRIAALEATVAKLVERVEELESSERSRVTAEQYKGYPG